MNDLEDVKMMIINRCRENGHFLPCIRMIILDIIYIVAMAYNTMLKQYIPNYIAYIYRGDKEPPDIIFTTKSDEEPTDFEEQVFGNVLSYMENKYNMIAADEYSKALDDKDNISKYTNSFITRTSGIVIEIINFLLSI